MAGRLEGKVAVVTGAASGIGAASARRFVEEGARVVIADLLDEEGHALAQALGENALYQRTDVTDEAQVSRVVNLAKTRFGKLDILFNNAGVGGPIAGLDGFDGTSFDRAMAVLVKGVFHGFKYAVPLMRAERSGVILTTASVAGMQAGFAPHVYSAAKAAVIQLTRTAAMELGIDKIRVNCIAPGAIATPIFARALGMDAQTSADSVNKLKTTFKRLQPLPIPGQSEDVAEAAVYLASDAARFVSGQTLVVDGALTVGQRSPDGSSPLMAAVAGALMGP